MGPFEETSKLPSNRQEQPIPGNGDTLFDWLLRRAEADLGIVQLLAAREAQRADQIKRLEDTLITQIDRLQHQALESHNAELGELKVKLLACSDHITRLEAAHAEQNDVKTSVKNELSTLREEFSAWQTELEARCLGVESIKESLVSSMYEVQRQLHENITKFQTTQEDICHLKSETRSLAERLTHAESAAWQTRTLALSNAQQLQQNTEAFRDEIVTLNALVNQLNERSPDAFTLPESLLAETTQHIQTQIAAIQHQLDHNYDIRRQRDEQLARLDSAIATLAERIHNSESLSSETLALVQSQADSTTKFRDQITQGLAALQSSSNDAATAEQRTKESDVILRTKLDQLEHRVAQTLALQEQRTSELEQSVNQLSKTIATEIAQQQDQIGNRVYALESGYDELLNTRPHIQLLEQRALRWESEAQEAQSRANAAVITIEALETDLKARFNTLQVELSKLAEYQKHLRPIEEMRELEHNLKEQINHINQKLTIERNDFDHWANGLRASFAAELSAIQTRLSERQTQIEHNYDRLERWEEIVNTDIGRLKTQLQETILDQRDTFVSELDTLQNRTSELESQTRKAADRIIEVSQHTEQSIAVISGRLSGIEASVERYSFPTSESTMRVLEDKFELRLHEVQEEVTRQSNIFVQRDSARTQQFEQAVHALKHELEVLKKSLDQNQENLSLSHPMWRVFEESILSRLTEIEQRLQDKLTLTDNRGIDRSLQAQKLIDTLQDDIAEIKISLRERPMVSESSSISKLQDSLAAKIQKLQQQLGQRLTAFDKSEAGLTRQAEQAIASLRTEIATLNADRIDQSTVLGLFEPALRGLEESLSAKLEHLRQEMTQEISNANRRDAELRELNERCQSFIQRAAALGVSVQSADNLPPADPRPADVSPELNASHASLLNGASDHPSIETQASGEKEQLIKLQERMSSEIERVRAQLKEKSGRWKVRKSAS